MRYIKEYNSFKEFTSINSAEYVKLVLGYDDLVTDNIDKYIESFIKENWEEFTESEILEIEKIMGKVSLVNEFDNDIHNIYVDDNDVSITKLKDEWYYVKYQNPGKKTNFIFQNPSTSEYFKCDQLFGLLSLLKKIKLYEN